LGKYRENKRSISTGKIKWYAAYYEIYPINENKGITVYKNVTASDGTLITETDQNTETDARWDENCHGYTFLREEAVWIDLPEALQILKVNYKRTSKRKLKIGDVITYHDKVDKIVYENGKPKLQNGEFTTETKVSSEPAHSVTVTNIEYEKFIFIFTRIKDIEVEGIGGIETAKQAHRESYLDIRAWQNVENSKIKYWKSKH